MNPQKTSKLLTELKEEVNRLEQEASTSVRRRDIAKNEADNLEDRNKRALQLVEQEVESHRKEIIAEAEATKEKYNKENVALEKVKVGLQDDIAELSAKQQIKTEENDILKVEYNQLTTSINTAKNELTIILEETAIQRQEKEKHQDKIAKLTEQIAQLETLRQDVNQDIEALGTESDNLENNIIELDATFKARKETFDAQLKDIQLKINNALMSLTEAQNKDSEIRQEWANEHEKLEKRTHAVRKMEARLSNAEARVAELDNYLKL